jgi:hypothetical protein
MDPTEPEPTVVRISTVADVLGVLPHRLGFQPAESIVVICLAGSRSREQLVMRVDLPARGGERGFARHLADRAKHAGATSAIVVCYTDAPRDEVESGLARDGLVDALVTRLTRRGIGVVEALLVRRGRWWSYHCADPACCSGSGSPVPDRLTPAASHYAAESVLSGAVVLADREELVRSVEPGLHAVAGAAREQAVCRAADTLAAAAERDGPAGAREMTLRTFDRLAAAWAERGTAPDADDAALVTLGLHDSRTRDEVMTLVLDHDPGVLVGMLCDLARRTGDDVAAPVCTVLAWAAYADGGGALASVAAERALRASPGYSMAQLVLDGLSQMVPPSAIREVSRDVRTDLDEVG